MKKKLLISLSLLFSVLFSLSAAPYYLIKDGKLADGVVQKPYAPLEEGAYDTIVFNEEYDGKTVAAYYHNGANYKDVRFDLSGAPLDLTKTWVMTMKYVIPTLADTLDETFNTFKALKACSATDGTKPAFWMGLGAEVDSINLNTIDLAYYVLGAVESIENGGQWIEKKVVLTVPKHLTVANSFVIGYAREAGAVDIAAEPAYIEEISFDAAGEFPFFMEDFTAIGGAITNDGDRLANDEAKWKSGATFTYGNKNIGSIRLWDKPWDDSKMPACEIPHAIKVTKKWKNFKIVDIALPEGLESFYIDVLAKAEISTAADGEKWAALEETPAARPLTVTAAFDVDPTNEVALLPNAIRNSMWEWNEGEVKVPSGATKVTITFSAEDCDFALLVNRVILSKSSMADAVIEIPSDINMDKVVVFEDNDMLVALANSSKIEVISLTGEVIASETGNAINISTLAKGVYVARITTSNGVVATTFVKK